MPSRNAYNLTKVVVTRFVQSLPVLAFDSRPIEHANDLARHIPPNIKNPRVRCLASYSGRVRPNTRVPLFFLKQFMAIVGITSFATVLCWLI